MQLLQNAFNILSTRSPPGIILSLATVFLQNGEFKSAYIHEFIGTLLMVFFTFSAGKWIGENSLPVAWIAHAFGVVAADYIGGGPHVNPGVTLSMFALGKCSYTEAYVRIAGAMAGGLFAFPIFRGFSSTFGLTPLGGPGFLLDEDDDDIHLKVSAAFFSEMSATFLLLMAIYFLNWELNFGKYHYWIKQPLTAVAIRYLIEVFPSAGPAMNPMLGTTWAVFSSDGNYPSDAEHYWIYWAGPFVGATLASFVYVIYAGGTFFGATVPFGPIKDSAKASSAIPATSEESTTTKSKKKKGGKKD